MSNPYLPPSSAVEQKSPKPTARRRSYRPGLRTKSGVIFGAAGAVFMVAGVFLPALYVNDDATSFAPTSGTSDGTFLLAGALLGLVCALLGRKVFQNLACLLGLFIPGATWILTRSRAAQFSSLLDFKVSTGIGLWLVFAGAVCFGLSAAKMLKSPKT